MVIDLAGEMSGFSLSHVCSPKESKQDWEAANGTQKWKAGDRKQGGRREP
jgi:hypothetical protein